MIPTQKSNYLRELLLTLLVLGLTFAVVLISLNNATQLKLIQNQGKLRVGTINSPMTWYLQRGDPAGFEYELSKAFADYLGVELELTVNRDYNELFNDLQGRSVHFLAANLLATDERRLLFKAGPIYRESNSVLIHRQRQGIPAPQTAEDLVNSRIGVLPGTSHEASLHNYISGIDSIDIITPTDADSIDLLRAVHEGELDYTVTDTFFFGTQRSFFPGLQEAFALGEPIAVSWLLPLQKDQSFINALNDFFAEPDTQALITELEARYFTQENPLNFFDTVSFRNHLTERFMPLKPYFSQAAENTGFALPLLAAIAYQESHWNADAVSPTGVRGVMMLTNAAASEVNIEDRTDAKQSILGGAQYLLNVKQRIPERIPEPDHTWFALAAYNIGYGHLEDARRLTQQLDGDPDRWSDVRSHLPKLAQERYYSQLRYGYARGHEPVRYVDNIRRYIDVFEWEYQLLTRENQEPPAEDEITNGNNPEDFRDISEKVLRNFAPSL
ncbi:membrane-bound lytic murein transglycosylase MltF [Nitrincola iocasae]|uniref:Membrane-bound lytic murein transglycosylase F n=1 Tax=Nitrincola iocasae TaxID=2614693 RepID=A0A5J6LAX9_9GAMM|nr:membrane-bound lytic murein transglycosylase MltF [Nitrincola iocasae]QEW05675.1 membrane-bound lytic murein transglycosylase MltF [Nitrincola iocasae]